MILNSILIISKTNASSDLTNFIKKTPLLQLSCVFDKPSNAFLYSQQEVVDVIFVDIHLQGISSIEFIEVLGTKYKVIVASDVPDHAAECYEYGVIDYLLKPITFNRYLKSVYRTISTTTFINPNLSVEDSKDFILVKTEVKGKMIKINTEEIYYIEGMRNYLSIFTKNDKIIALLNLKDIEKKLSSSRFIRIHRSYIVNIDRVHTIENSRVILKSFSNSIPLGGTYREVFYQNLKARIV